MQRVEALFFDELAQPEEIVRQCDACLENVALHRYNVVEPNHSHLANSFHCIPIDTHRFIILSATAIAVVNQKALQLLEQFSTVKRLTQIDTYTQKLIQYGFLRQPHLPTSTFSQKIERLTAWIHLTDSCNLRCRYCFLPHEPKFLSLSKGKEIINRLVETAHQEGINKLKLKYAGGEPLQNLVTLKALHAYAKSQIDIKLTASLLTNGTLLNREILQWIQRNSIKLVISLDAIHPQYPQRIDQNGNESSQRVIQNITLATQMGVTPFISITITHHTVEALPELVQWLLEKKLPFSINFYKGKEAIDQEQIICFMLKAFKHIEKNPPNYSLLNCLLDMTDLSQPHLQSCSVGKNYLIFDTEGNIAQCPMTLNTPIAPLDTPNILSAIQNRHNPVQNRSIDEHQECRSCEWRYWCGGGCSVMNGYYGGKSPYCRVYKRLFPEVLRLEGMRVGRKDFKKGNCNTTHEIPLHSNRNPHP